jgi:glycosyltransferase involved in cell wall biosynthesis/GT2 family glycosyltransferase
MSDPAGAHTSRPLQVTVVSPSTAFGGAEHWLLGVMDRTDRCRFRAIALGDGADVSEFERRGVPVAVVPTGSGPVSMARSVDTVRRLLADDRPDVVLANGVKAAAVGVPAGFLAGVRTVWAKHDFVWDRELGRPVARLADSVIATSPQALGSVGADGLVVPPPWPEPPAEDRARARRFWEEQGLSFGRPTVAMVTRLIGCKGIEDAVRALADPAGAGWQLVVVGDEDPTAPGHRAHLESLARDLGCAGRTRFTGPVPAAARWLAAFDAVAVLTRSHPDSRYDREGFSIAALEAVAAGVPVIATEGTPALDVLGPAGRSVPAGSPVAVAAALAQVLDGGDGTRQQVEEVRSRLEKDHPRAGEVASAVVTHLSEVARRAGAGTRSDRPVSVVTTVLDEATAIGALLDRVVPQLGPGDELVVVDGGSTDGTVEHLEEVAAADPRVRLLVAPGANISRGRNLGIAAATHDRLAITDAGCEPTDGWLEALRAGFDGEPAPDLVTGVYRVSTDSLVDRASALSCYPDPDEAAHPTPLSRVAGRVFGKTFQASLPTGRSAAFTRDAWTRAGGFREDLPTAEDVTFGREIVRTGGHAALTVDAAVVWRQRPDPGATWRMFRRYGYDGARSGDRLLVARDLARAGAYAAAPVLALRGGRAGRAALVVAGIAYCLPVVARARRNGEGPAATALAPVTLVLKDLAKASGCVAGLAASRRT